MWGKFKKTRSVLTSVLILLIAFLVAVTALGVGMPVWAVALMVGIPVLGYFIAKLGVKVLRYPATAFTVLVVAGCSLAAAEKPEYQLEMEKLSNEIALHLTKAVPYPLSEMTDSLERRMLRERLLRFNQPSKIGYVYVFNYGSRTPVGYYVIKGKVSATESQMTNPDQSWSCGDNCEFAVKSIEDDGSWGPEEGGTQGIFFFTASGVLTETTLPWLYSDAPNPLWENLPQLAPTSAKPSSVSKVWESNGGLGGKG